MQKSQFTRPVDRTHAVSREWLVEAGWAPVKDPDKKGNAYRAYWNIAAVMEPKRVYLERRERIQKAKELVELREIGKSIQGLYFWKGNIILWANGMQAQKRVEDVEYVRDLFAHVAERLDYIWLVMSETPLLNTQLGSEAALQIAKAKKIYEALRDLPDQAIIEDRGLLDILAEMQEMAEVGNALLMKVDEHRRQIDHTHD